MDLSRYRRQMLYPGLGESGQEKLALGRVGLIGCGALGSFVAAELVRGGVGFLRLVDRDFPELSNLHRQILYDEQDVSTRTPKALAAARELRTANHEAEIEPVVEDLNAFSIERFARGLDVLVDATDNFATRFVINDYAVRQGIPWVHGGVLGASGVSLTVVPGDGPCFRCLYPEPPAPGSVETCDTAGVLTPAVGVIGSIEAAEVMKLLADPGSRNRGLLTVDVWETYFEVVEIERLSDCPACGRREFAFLEAEREFLVDEICGSDAIQIVPPGASPISLSALAERLAPVARVSLRELYLEAETEGIRFTIFGDGRTLVTGADSAERARSVYDRFIGS